MLTKDWDPWSKNVEEIKTTKHGPIQEQEPVEGGLYWPHLDQHLLERTDHHPHHGPPLGGGRVVGHEHLPEV